jgi:hypothetical protein
MRATGNQVRAGVQPVEKARASCDEVKAPGMGGADTMLHKASCRGKHHVGGDGTDQNGIEVGGGNAALGQSGARGFDGHVGGGNVGSRDMTLFYTRPFDDPLVVRLDHFLQVGIRKNPGRSVATEGGDFRSKRAQFP